MSLTKTQTRIISLILFGLAIIIFTPFLDMNIKALSVSDNISRYLFETMHVFFFTTWLYIHIPAFVLIGLGIYFLRKSRNLQKSMNVN